MRTLEQDIAAQVYDQVAKYGEQHAKGSTECKQYGSMAYKLPILVRTAGLAQALAFVESRGSDPSHKLLEHLAQVVSESSKKDFLDQIRNAEMNMYIYLTRRTMLALKWYKRFAESVLEVTATDEGPERGSK